MTIRNSAGFEWDRRKAAVNAEKHGILFEEAIRLFDQPFLRIRSDRSGEIRWTGLGNAQGRIIAVIYTERNGRIRIISARMARKNEREIYKDRIGVTS
ncbi:MAG: BrnT family toxin [Methylocystis sp.]